MSGKLPNKRIPFRERGRFAKCPSLEALGLVWICPWCSEIHCSPFPERCLACSRDRVSGCGEEEA